MIPGSKVGSRETETGDGEKPREGGQMAIITVDAYGLILPESLRIACGKDGTLWYLSASWLHSLRTASVYCSCPTSPSCAVYWLNSLLQLQRKPWSRELEWHVACWGGKSLSLQGILYHSLAEIRAGPGGCHKVLALYHSDLFVLLLSARCHCTLKVVATISRKDSVQEK